MQTVLRALALLISVGILYGLPARILRLPQQPAFEVATVKPNAQGSIDIGGGMRVLSGRTHCHGIDTHADPKDPIPLPALGRCSVQNSTLKEMINVAYDLNFGFARTKVNQMIAGGPNWTESESFDVEGKAEEVAGTSETQLHLMLQSLLAERFKLKIHRETRELSGYGLFIAKNGSKLKKAEPDEKSTTSFSANTARGQNAGVGSITGLVALRLGRFVNDRTDLQGGYDFTLTWTPDDNELGLNGQPVRPTGDNSGPSLITALQEQLGLRLESEKMSAEVIVIDSVSRPTDPNV